MKVIAGIMLILGVVGGLAFWAWTAKELGAATIQEARERGDLSAERAKTVMKDALGRAQSAASGAKERLDFVHQSEIDALRAEVEALRNRLDLLEGRVSGLAGLEKEPPEDRE